MLRSVRSGLFTEDLSYRGTRTIEEMVSHAYMHTGDPHISEKMGTLASPFYMTLTLAMRNT